MAWASVTYIFSPSTVAKSSEVNTNFSDVVAGLDKAMPSGGIIIWSGSVASIPAGWYLCNGANSTPDLRGKFVLGAGGAYAVGATGGAETHTLTVAEMPAHNHGGGVHNHGITDPGHYHTIGHVASDQDGSGSNGSISGSSNTSTAYTGISINNSGTIINTEGGGGAHNNMPPYYALCFIMKS